MCAVEATAHKSSRSAEPCEVPTNSGPPLPWPLPAEAVAAVATWWRVAATHAEGLAQSCSRPQGSGILESADPGQPVHGTEDKAEIQRARQ